jgi:hypothetical protein
LHPLGVLANDGDFLQAQLADQVARNPLDQAFGLVHRMDRAGAEDVFVVLIVLLDLGRDRG